MLTFKYRGFFNKSANDNLVNDFKFAQNSLEKKSRIYNDDMEQFFPEPQSRLKVELTEFFQLGTRK